MSSSGIDAVSSRHPATTSPGGLGREEQQPAEDRRAHRVQREFHRSHDTEVAAAAPQSPEQVGVLFGAGMHETAVRRDDICADKAVAGEAVATHQPTEAAAEREPADPRGRDEPAGDRQAEGLCFVVEVGPGGTALRGGAAVLRVDGDGVHVRQVDDHPAVAGREPGDAVPATPHGHHETLAARELHRFHHVSGAGTANDQCRVLVVGSVPDRSGLVVIAVGGQDDLTSQRALQLAHGGFTDDFRRDVVDVMTFLPCPCPRCVGCCGWHGGLRSNHWKGR